MAEAIVAHARAEQPLEACGLIIGSAPAAEGGLPLRFVPCRNAAASPVRFTIDPADIVGLLVDADEAGQVVWAIVHSHTATPAVPSRTDTGMAHWWPSALWILVSLAPGEADPVTCRPSLRAWSIEGGTAAEVPVQRDPAPA